MVSTGTNPNGDNLLASLAILSVNWDVKNAAYLDNFVPFVLDAVRAGCGGTATDQEATEALRDRFGVTLPTKVVKAVLSRASRKGMVKMDLERHSLTAKGFQRTPDIVSQQGTQKRQHRALFRNLATFAQTRHGLVWTEDDAEQVLVDYVIGRGVVLLRSIMSDQAPEELSDHERDFVVSTYITEIFTAEPQLFQYLEMMVKGSMLSSALYLPTAIEMERRFKRTTLWLDTPVALRWIGLEGPEAREAVEAILSQAMAQGAEIGVFRHTLREMRGVVEAAAHSAGRGKPVDQLRGVSNWFRRQAMTKADGLLECERIEATLERFGVGIKETLTQTHTLAVDEVALEEALQSRVHYNRREALLNDLDSLTAVHRLRHGSAGVADRLEECHAILVTDNPGLVVVAARFFGEYRNRWPLAIADHDLAALVWLKKPVAAPDLPKSQIMADAFAALEPGPQLWHQYQSEIDRRASRGDLRGDELVLLQYGSEARSVLMDETHGDPQRFKPVLIDKIQQRIRDVAAAPAEANAADLRSQLGREESEHARQLEEELSLRQENENKLGEQTAQISSLHSAIEERDARQAAALRTKAQRRANWVGGAIVVILVLVLGALSEVLKNQSLLAGLPEILRTLAPYIGGGVGLAGGGVINRNWAAPAVASLLEARYRRAEHLDDVP